MKAVGRELEGKVALITGAGSGIGRAMAELFAERGCAIVAVDVVAERVDQVVSAITSHGGRAIGMVRNLSLQSDVERMVDDALSSQGKIDILCNNAGVMDNASTVPETSDELWERVMDINLNAPFRTCRKVIPIMLERGGGVILNTASVAGLFGGRAGAAYTVSKHGLIGLTKNIAATYGSKGIRCNAMALGGVKTAIGIGGGTPSQLGMEVLTKTMSVGARMAEPIEIARLALFLVSDDASNVNGSIVTADGGWTAP